jgi:hypothetical protein
LCKHDLKVVAVLLVLLALAWSTSFQYYFLDREMAKKFIDWKIDCKRDWSASTTAPPWVPNPEVGANYYTMGSATIDALIIDERVDLFRVYDDAPPVDPELGPKAWLYKCINAPSNWWTELKQGYFRQVNESGMVRPWMTVGFVAACISAFIAGLFARARVTRHHRLVQSDLLALPWSVILFIGVSCALAGGALCWYLTYNRSWGLPHGDHLGQPPLAAAGLIALVALAFGFALGRRVILEPERRRRGLCPACAYTLPATGPCPECGPIPALAENRPWLTRRFYLIVFLALFLPAAGLVAAAVYQRQVLQRNTIARWMLLRPVPDDRDFAWRTPAAHAIDAQHWFNYEIPGIEPKNPPPNPPPSPPTTLPP